MKPGGRAVLRNFQLVHVADKAGRRHWLAGADRPPMRDGGVERGQRRAERCRRTRRRDRAVVLRRVGDDGEMVPASWPRWARRAAARAVDVDEGHAVVDADEKVLRAVAAAEDDARWLQRGGLDPSRPGHGPPAVQASEAEAGMATAACRRAAGRGR